MKPNHRRPIQLRCLVVEPSPLPMGRCGGGEGLGGGRRCMRWIEGVDRRSSLAPVLSIYLLVHSATGDRFISTATFAVPACFIPLRHIIASNSSSTHLSFSLSLSLSVPMCLCLSSSVALGLSRCVSTPALSVPLRFPSLLV